MHPYKDDKILTDWNGLMIVSLARAFRINKEEKYEKAFERAVYFILNKLVNKDGFLMHRYRDGGSGINANIDDYASFIWGLIEAYEASFSMEYLGRAIQFTDQMIELFWDGHEGGFFFTSKNSEKLLLRNKEWYDGALPSGNSIAAHILSRLFFLTGIKKYQDMAFDLMKASSKLLEIAPIGSSVYDDGIEFPSFRE